MSSEHKEIAEKLKKLPFAKSWQNHHVANVHNILDINTGEVNEKELNDFIYLPVASGLRYYSNDTEFLRFRNEHKNDSIMDFKLIDDKFENENARILLLYVAIMLAELKIRFMIGDKYGVYIEINELHEKADKHGEYYKKLYNHFAIPTTIAHKNGLVEQWSN